jgi:hypothetical protein
MVAQEEYQVQQHFSQMELKLTEQEDSKWMIGLIL